MEGHPNGRRAACEILHNISIESEKGSILEKGKHLEHMLSQTPAEWFHPLPPAENHTVDDDNEDEGGGPGGTDIEEAVGRAVRSLAARCHVLLKFDSEGEAEAGNGHNEKFKEHAKAAYSALSMISILLSKLGDAANSESAEEEMRRCNSSSPCGVDQADPPSRNDAAAVGGESLEEKVRMCSLEEEEMEKMPDGVGRKGHFSITPQATSLPEELLSQLTVTVEEGDSCQGDDAHGQVTGVRDRSLGVILKSIVGPCLLLSATHSLESPWTNRKCLQASKALLTRLVQVCGHDSVPSLLQGRHLEKRRSGAEAARGQRLALPRGGFGLAMREVKQQLNREEWKRYPAARHSFAWLLGHMKHPYLGDHLDSCLPPSLLLVDDYNAENKIMGIQCLHHIINQVDPTELRRYGRADVVHQALHPLLHRHAPDLIDVLYPCLLSLLRVAERDPRRASDVPHQLGKYDEALRVILTNMEGEQRIAVRQANARHLAPYVEAMGSSVLLHMKRLVRVITGYLEESDGPEETGRILTLKVLQTVILQAWPRIPNHCVELMKCLLRLLIDISVRKDLPSQVVARIREESIHCLVLLKRSCGAVVEDSLNKLLGSDLDNPLLEECFRKVLDER